MLDIYCYTLVPAGADCCCCLLALAATVVVQQLLQVVLLTSCLFHLKSGGIDRLDSFISLYGGITLSYCSKLAVAKLKFCVLT